MKKQFNTLLLLILLTANAIASLDTSKIILMEEVKVLGEKFSISKEEIPFSYSSISKNKIENLNGGVISNVLKSVSGLHLKSYGGVGSVETISIRGMGSEYVVVLIDGERISSYQNGLFELGKYLSGDVEQIEILKGGSASIFGANAVGGVINITTKKPKKDFSAKISSGVGSYKLFSELYEFNYGNDNYLLRFNRSIEFATNDYDFDYNDGLKTYSLKRNGSDYKITSTSFKIIPQIKNSNLVISINHSNANRGVPSAVTSQYQFNNANIYDEQVIVQSSFKKIISDNLSFTNNVSFNKSYYQFTDLRGNIKTNEYSVNDVASGAIGLNYSLPNENIITVNLDASQIDIYSSNLKKHLRNQVGFSLSSTLKNILLKDLIILPSFRKEYYSDFESATSFQIGANLKIFDNPNVRIKSSFGKNYRTPTFNDLFWIGSGNENLKMEKSFSFDFGIISEIELIGKTSIEANIFNIDSRDRIIWMPSKGEIWKPENVSRVVSSGFEFDLSEKLFDENLQFDFSYTFMNALRKDNSENYNKQLAYLPHEMLNAGISVKYSNINFTLNHNYTGFRFANENNNPRSVMNEFNTTDVSVATEITLSNYILQTNGTVENIFNKNYELIKSFPMPKRKYKLTISIIYK